MSKTTAWFVLWECHCVDVQTSRDRLPAVCPGHFRGQVADPEQLDVLPEFVDSHDCGGTLCPSEVTA